MCLEVIASCICNVVVRLCCCFGVNVGAGTGAGAGAGSCSIWECCAMIYCYHKIKTCCTAIGTKISNCCESTKNNIKDCCKSITDVCSDEHNNNIDADIILAGTGQIDSAEEHV